MIKPVKGVTILAKVNTTTMHILAPNLSQAGPIIAQLAIVPTTAVIDDSYIIRPVTLNAILISSSNGFMANQTKNEMK